MITVVLEVGLETFIYRRPDLADRLQVFELDQSATQMMNYGKIMEDTADDFPN